MVFVPDASVAAAWVLPDEEAALADFALDRLGAETAKAQGVFWHELRTLLLSAECRGHIDGRHADASMARLGRLRIRIADETDDREVTALARAHRLTAYDASYLALAIHEGLCAGEPRPAPERSRSRRRRGAVRLICPLARNPIHPTGWRVAS